MILILFLSWLIFFISTNYFVFILKKKSFSPSYIAFSITASTLITFIQLYTTENTTRLQDNLILAFVIGGSVLIFLIALPKARDLFEKN